MPTSNNLTIVVNHHKVGELLKEDSSYIFRYQNEVDETGFVSLTMPVRARNYEHSKLPPVFEMHLPEGYLLAVIQKHLTKVIGNDDLSLLGALAQSIRGRVQYQATNTSPKPDTTLTLDALLDPADNLFEELLERFALRSAISGVQPKVLAQIQDKATLQLEDYIVKTWGDEYPELALNEYWCMKIVQAANIPVPEFYLSADARLFIMKRFDITNNHYLGFEDACVLQGKGREDKYEGSYELLAKTILSFVSPQHKIAAMKQYFKMTVLNQILQNGDAHLKNFGILYQNTHNIWLAPAYDIVSTTAYIKNDMPALTLMGSRKWWPKKHLIKFGQQHCNLTAAQATELYQECVNACQKIAQQLEVALNKNPSQQQKEILQHLLAKVEGHHFS